MRLPVFMLAVGLSSGPAIAFDITLSDQPLQTTPVFSDVTRFSIRIEIDAPLEAGAFVNPAIVNLEYQVTGTLEPGTPSGFPAFDLQRNISGAEFYAQGSSLSFEISPTAVLSDGLQAAELVGAGIVFTFNGREIDNGRFHPAVLELDATGAGRIQNSNNVPSLNPLVEVDFGEEYVTDLAFDPGNLTLVEPARAGGGGGGGSSSLGLGAPAALSLVVLAGRRRRGARRSMSR